MDYALSKDVVYEMAVQLCKTNEYLNLCSSGSHNMTHFGMRCTQSCHASFTPANFATILDILAATFTSVIGTIL